MELKTKVRVYYATAQPENMVWEGEVLGDIADIHIRNKVDADSHIALRDVEAIDIVINE